MIEQIKVGDKLTVIKVNSLAVTSISEITIDSIHDGRAIFAAKRKKYYLTTDNSVLVLKGHSLGITHGSWNDGGSCFIMSGNCNLGGLDRETMITLLKTNINPVFNQWEKIYWFDGTSDKGDPIFVSRPISDNYLRHREEAEANNAKTAGQINVGDFIYSYQKGSKHNNLKDMLQYHLTADTTVQEQLTLGKIVAIIEISEEKFDSLDYSHSDLELPDKGGDYSSDIPEDRETNTLSEFELETFYSHHTLIRTPSGRAITVDPQGCDYMRYTGLLPHYKTTMAADCAKVSNILRIEKEKAEAKEQAKKNELFIQENEEKIRIQKETPGLTPVTDYYDYKIAAANLRKILKTKYPATKFSVVNRHSGYYDISWTDGPTATQVDQAAAPFLKNTRFKKHYGTFEHLFTSRTITPQRQTEELALINAELGKTYTMKDYVTERIEHMSQLVHKRTCQKDYSTVSKPAQKETTPTQTVAATNIQIIDYSEKAFAVVGDTKPIKDLLNDLGGSFNARLKCGAGWIFSKKKLETVKQTLSIQ